MEGLKFEHRSHLSSSRAAFFVKTQRLISIQGLIQSFTTWLMWLDVGPLLHRAKLISHVTQAEPGGSRGTVVIVRTRVGFGVSLVGGVELVCRCSNGQSAPQTATFGEPPGTLKSINFNQPPEAKPIPRTPEG